MSFRDLAIRSSYETLNENPVEDFYIPVLEEAVRYDRIAGYFSSTSLALAARGVAGLIANGGHMRLIVSPHLSEEDAEVMRSATVDPHAYIEKAMLAGFDDLGSTLEADHVKALGWMLANGMLEIQIASVVSDNEEDNGPLFHQKVGVLEDAEGNLLSFSGSINETASGWLRNAEEFKVFCEWKEGQRVFFESDERKFTEFWEGQRPYVDVFEPSEAFKQHLVKSGEGFDSDKLTLKRYLREQKYEEAREQISLFEYQGQAVEAWRRHEGRLLFEMATGTGKTRTAIACVNCAKAESEKFVCITAAPEVTLARQWAAEYEKLGVEFDEVVFADSSSGGKAVWASAIRRGLSRIMASISSSMLVLVTHASSCVDSFTSLFSELPSDFTACFVGDEVHGLGAPRQRHALLDRYDLRIGLSATPTRWFDDEGTALLVDYFGNASFVFSIRDAQTTINPLTGHPFLTPYNYRLQFVSLDDEEMDEYCALSEKISKLSFSDEEEASEVLERLLMKRADITKNAKEKIPAFEQLVQSMVVEQTLVFTSPQQIDEVVDILSAHCICAHPFTEKQGTRRVAQFGGRSEREYLIKEFSEGRYQALVAISCLDEGIDIPSAQRAILLSSSTNPREYIQRIGRVIRYHETKEVAEIVDFVVEPDWSRIDDSLTIEAEKRAFEKELVRIREMAENARNGIDVLLSIDERLERLWR